MALDLNGDGSVDALDLTLFSAEFSKPCASTGPNTGEGRDAYNGDGLRVRQLTDPAAGLTIDDYVWDQGAPLPQMLQDT